MKLSVLPIVAVSAGLLFSSGCSSSEAPKSEAKKEAAKKAPVEPITGQSALFKIYQVARMWSGDVMILSLKNENIEGIAPQPGKYPAWRAVMVSPSKKLKKTYTWAAEDNGPAMPGGVFALGDESYVRNPSVFTFSIQDAKADTTEALEEALKQAETKEFVKKNPDVPVQFLLEWTTNTPVPAWRVIWGRTVSMSTYSVYVSAVDKKFLKKAR